jgi:phage shock protein C
MAEGKLRRRRDNKYIAGVAGGMADWLGVSSFWIRLLWFILLIPGGLPGIIPYVICWIIVPREGK